MEDKEYLQSMGLKIKDLRIKKGYTQDELAQKMGYISRSTINKIEKGLVDMPQSKLQKIAQVLDTTIFYLIGLNDNPNGNKNKISIISEEYGAVDYYLNNKETKEIIEFIEQYFEEDKK